MSIDVFTVADVDEWNSLVEKSSQKTPFHRYESLRVIEEHADATLYPYVGYKGQEPVGVFPIFELSKGPFNVMFSPPPDLKVTYLGPIQLNLKEQKQRRREKTNKRFVYNCIEDMESSSNTLFTHVYMGFRHPDARPFIWSNFNSQTRYTYLVDIGRSEEDIIMSFSSDARKNIRNTDQNRYEIYLGGKADIKRIIRHAKERHKERNATYNITSEFVVGLYSRLPEDIMNVYVCETENKFAGGLITLELGNTIYRWQSWTDLDADVPVNDLLDWRIITQARNRNLKWYDLVGANIETLSSYKAKFNPELRTYQRVQKGTPGMNLISKIYKQIR